MSRSGRALAVVAAIALPGVVEGFAAADPAVQVVQAAPAMQAAPPPLSSALQGASDLERLIGRLDSEERALDAELAETGPKLDLVHRRMLARGRIYYRYVRAGLLPAGGGFDALVDHAARVERTRMAVERDLATEVQLTKRRDEITERLTHVRAERAPLDAQREAMTRARTVLAEADERRSAFARAFETSARPDSVAIYGADIGPSEPEAHAGFRAQKGRLRFPVAGRTEVHRVHRKTAGGPGLELLASLGSPVRAVAAGRVAFADRYDEYGLTVIVDHGDHYYSVYGNLGSADVHVGETVVSGGKIGAVGSEGGRPPLCYLELRHKSDTIDPSPWLGL